MPSYVSTFLTEKRFRTYEIFLYFDHLVDA